MLNLVTCYCTLGGFRIGVDQVLGRNIAGCRGGDVAGSRRPS